MARDFSRTDRVADAIQRELAQLILREIKDPRLGMVTLSMVKVSKDLAHAKVYVNVMHEAQVTDSMEVLNRAAPFLRGLLAKKIKIRVIPALTFIYDDTTLKANRISRLIDEAIAKDKRPEDDHS